MGKGKRNKAQKKDQFTQTKIEKTSDIKQKKGISIMALIPIILSVIALGVSICMACVQYIYSQAEYEYKRDPKFDVGGEMILRRIPPQGEEHITIPAITSFNVEIAEENNIDQLYFISPSKEVQEIYVNDDVEEQVNRYFNEEYKKKNADILSDDGEISYFYRFMVYSSLDDKIEIKVIYAKLEEMNAENEYSSTMELQVIDKIKILEFEKAHLNDPNYEGERQIAAEYRELEKYYEKYL